jgi:signal transduction histidine kinase
MPVRLGLRFVWVITSALLVLVVVALSFEGLRRAAEEKAASDELGGIQVKSRSVLIGMLTAESGQRGYLVTGERAYLAPYHDALQHIGAQLVALERAVRAHPMLAQQCAQVRPLVDARLDELARVIQLHDAGDKLQAVALMQSNLGLATMTRLREVLDRLRERAVAEGAGRDVAYQQAADVSKAVLATGSILAVLLALFFTLVLRRDVRKLELANMTIASQTGKLTAQAEYLARSNRDLDQFAYVASHDLKAPLRGIASLATWIEEDLAESGSAETKDHLRLLRGRVNRLEKLIDGILAYSRAGRLPGQTTRVEVGKLVRDTVDLLAPPAQFTVEVAPELPTMTTEATELGQVFSNLVGNAIKYGCKSDGAPCTIRVGGKKSDGVWTFFVADEGPGIAPEFHERIFGIFQTLAPRDKVESTGIGLAVVKRLVERRGGRAWVDSATGRGATFWFTWPERPEGERGQEEDLLRRA